VLVHLAILVHVAHWKMTGSTLTPVEPSEAMQTLELGYVNAGFLLFALAILATLILGRFFCGWACHVVAYQDLCAWLLARVGLRPRPVRSRLLVFVPLGAALYMFVWPQVARVLEGRAFPGLELHLSTEELWATFPGPWVAALTFLVDGFLVVWLLGAKGFCTYGCPYGAVFGLAERAAPGRIRVTDGCEGCGHCTATCTSNVEVHAEVAKYGQVVDPGCMKCMDCVSVCPKGALFFGFRPAHTRERKRAPVRRPRREYDFTWTEELGMAATFSVALYGFRGLYDLVPFLLALGLSVLTALAVVTGWRLIRSRDFSLQHHVLRQGGALTAPGATAALSCLAALALVADSAVVQRSDRLGSQLLDEAGWLPRGQREDLLERSLAHLLRAEAFGLVPVAELEFKIASILREHGETDEAIARMRRAIELRPDHLVARLALADVLMVSGDEPGAERALEELLAIDPEYEQALARKRGLEAQRARQP
jgi:NAD-dependent dihydropyrimidine dehydrogenase PreA subunit